MNTLHHPPATHDVYDPDEVVPKNSPLLQARSKVELQLSPTSSLDLSSHDPDSPHSPDRRYRRHGQENLGDAVLVSFLGTEDRHREIAQLAAEQGLPPDTSEDSESSDESVDGSAANPSDSSALLHRIHPSITHHRNSSNMSVDSHPPPPPADGLRALQSLATSALGVAFGDHRAGIGSKSRTPTSLDMTPVQDRTLAVRTGQPEPTGSGGKDDDDQRPRRSATSQYSPRGSAYSQHSPLQSAISPIYSMSLRSPISIPARPVGGDLPRIHDVVSPSSERRGSQNPLPSFRETFSDLKFTDAGANGPIPSPYPQSPSTGLQQLASLSVNSPPMSPNEPFVRRGDIPSPAYVHHSASASPNYSHLPPQNGVPRQSIDYSSSSATETPGSTVDYVSTPSNPSMAGQRMSIDGLTTTMGTFECKVTNCTALPFQTQYLLNSHMNVHSSERPHYCPVKGCPRSEGGKGFKRKNEMIRHGLVHDSPGYICPFCPDREHKYPRPDNLQRHVRVHHVDKDKDDQMLRDVLAQRPDGPSRGRRRRHGPV